MFRALGIYNFGVRFSQETHMTSPVEPYFQGREVLESRKIFGQKSIGILIGNYRHNGELSKIEHHFRKYSVSKIEVIKRCS